MHVGDSRLGHSKLHYERVDFGFGYNSKSDDFILR